MGATLQGLNSDLERHFLAPLSMVDLAVKKPPDFSLEGFCIGYVSLVYAFLLFRIADAAME